MIVDRAGRLPPVPRRLPHHRRALPSSTPLHVNAPVIMAMLGVWYANVLGAQTKAVLPYAQELRRFPAYLQQLDMEIATARACGSTASPCHDDTGPIVWGEPGTNGQHAFYQLLHQGTRLVPIDFIGFAQPNHPLLRPARPADGQPVRPGRGAGVRQDARRGDRRGHPRASAARTGCSRATGRAPRSSPRRLTPGVLGQLIALYEHIVFVQGTCVGRSTASTSGASSSARRWPTGSRPS